MTLGTGTLSRNAPGIMTGEASFAVRGTKALALDLLTREDGQNTARLRVGPDAGRVAEFHGNPMVGEPARFWHGFMHIEGYEMRVRLIPGDVWVAEFHDCVQRDPQRYQVMEAPA